MKLSFISKGEIKSFPDKQRKAEGLCHHQACLTRAPEESTKYGKEKLGTSHCKNIPNAKDHQQKEEYASTNGQNSQLASKWQYQIHT